MSSSVGRKNRLGIGGLAIVALVVFTALPSLGSTTASSSVKTIGMDVTPTSAGSGSSTTFLATLYNSSPGTSNPNSFLITAPAGFTISNAVYSSGTTANASRVITFTTSTVSVASLDPLKSYNTSTKKPVVTIGITAVPTLTGCSNGSGTWTVIGYTGSGLTGNTFSKTTGNSTTTITASCTTISATTYNDLNASGGVRDSGEPNAGGFDVTLSQAGTPLQSTLTTDISGGATFLPVSAGTYTVCQAVRPGWSITVPKTPTPGCQDITVPGTTSVVFGDAADGTITVTKFQDTNFNRTRDENEGPLSGWAFQLKDANGNAIGSEQHTDETNGQIVYTVPAGQAYSVCETDPGADPASANYADDPWVNTWPGGDRCAPIPASADSVVGSGATFSLEFGNAQGTLGCDADHQAPPVSADGTTADLTRLPNPDGTCIPVPYTLTTTQDTVTFTKDLTTQPLARFQLTITWGLSAGDYPNFGTTTFDLDGNFTTEGDHFVPDSCVVLDGVAQFPANPDPSSTYWPAAGTAEKPWCLAHTSVDPAGSGMQVTETFIGSGDPTIVRSR